MTITVVGREFGEAELWECQEAIRAAGLKYSALPQGVDYSGNLFGCSFSVERFYMHLQGDHPTPFAALAACIAANPELAAWGIGVRE